MMLFLLVAAAPLDKWAGVDLVHYSYHTGLAVHSHRVTTRLRLSPDGTARMVERVEDGVGLVRLDGSEREDARWTKPRETQSLGTWKDGLVLSAGCGETHYDCKEETAKVLPASAVFVHGDECGAKRYAPPAKWKPATKGKTPALICEAREESACLPRLIAVARTPGIEDVSENSDCNGQGNASRLAAPPMFAPPPYTSPQLRDATRVGRTLEFRVEQEGKPASSMRMRFVSVTAEGTSVSIDDGPVHEATWGALQKHAQFPYAAAMVTEETITVPAGTFACLLYTVKHEGRLHRYWFAKTLPGPPVRYEIEKNRVRTELHTLMAHTPGE